ncbi:PEP-CTERM sorting domain-containing protein [uncultured Paraglaciecola sp.]|mgnify:CR=1 FL=1|uniref:PEP-CTERM sorting domain-containing protein n=1 Tax=uncultured Paraglaciecola sp. TaxID=1765024 RepID=UPI0026304794|nr:PEP-CTERM sorting domain-containing protein [uncultured Paraglaciecola sp.]
MLLNKLSKKVLSGVLLSAGLIASSQVVAENVGGVVWDPSSIFDFSSNSNLVEDLLSPGADGVFNTGDAGEQNMLQGFGLITNMNGTGANAFCPSGCELTYEFGGFIVDSIDPVSDAPNTLINFTGGWINFYVDSTTAYDVNDITTANDGGNLWLSLTGHAVGGSTIQATLTDFGGGTDAGTGTGLLDVTGGMAMENFDTDTETDGADWVFSTSFQPFQSGGATDDGFELFGTADFGGESIDVPEPTSLAILGLGLVGLAFGSRRKQK